MTDRNRSFQTQSDREKSLLPRGRERAEVERDFFQSGKLIAGLLGFSRAVYLNYINALEDSSAVSPPSAASVVLPRGAIPRRLTNVGVCTHVCSVCAQVAADGEVYPCISKEEKETKRQKANKRPATDSFSLDKETESSAWRSDSTEPRTSSELSTCFRISR